MEIKFYPMNLAIAEAIFRSMSLSQKRALGKIRIGYWVKEKKRLSALLGGMARKVILASIFFRHGFGGPDGWFLTTILKLPCTAEPFLKMPWAGLLPWPH